MALSIGERLAGFRYQQQTDGELHTHTWTERKTFKYSETSLILTFLFLGPSWNLSSWRKYFLSLRCSRLLENFTFQTPQIDSTAFIARVLEFHFRLIYCYCVKIIIVLLSLNIMLFHWMMIASDMFRSQRPIYSPANEWTLRLSVLFGRRSFHQALHNFQKRCKLPTNYHFLSHFWMRQRKLDGL